MEKYRCKLDMKNIQHPYYKSLVAIDHWCKENCWGTWMHEEKGFTIELTVYMFSEESDAMAFKLRWM